jgi:uracil-DNA glycosylase
MDLNMLFGDEWYTALEKLLKTNYWKALGQKVAGERIMYNIYPEKGSDLLFKAFRTTPLSEVKVVILGQDPYHDGSYDGFAFSNRDDGQRISPSLRNILKEVESDVYDGFQIDQNPDLSRWAEQGVLLINTAHTVRKKNPGSHLEYWRRFTSEVIHLLLQQERPIVWILWGAKAKAAMEAEPWSRTASAGSHHFIISPHPSPFSAHTGFFGSKPFTKANKFLEENGKEQIKW